MKNVTKLVNHVRLGRPFSLKLDGRAEYFSAGEKILDFERTEESFKVFC